MASSCGPGGRDRPSGSLDLEDLRALIGPRTRLVAFTAASNVLGTRVPVADVAAVVRAAGAWSFVDLVHSAPHVLPDVEAWGLDGAVFSPYKAWAPHLGVLYLGPTLRERLVPPRCRSTTRSTPSRGNRARNRTRRSSVGGRRSTTWGTSPTRSTSPPRRSGRGGAAVYAAIARHEAALSERLLRGLDGLGADRYGLPGVEEPTATVAFNHPQRDPADVARGLADAGVAVASGHAYAHDFVFRELGLEGRGGVVRASAVHYTDASDVDALLGAFAAL